MAYLTLKDEVERKAEGASDFVIGIDLGTTNSSAAVYSAEKKEPVVIPLEMGIIRNRIPSVVWYNEKDEKLVVGDPAKRASSLYPEAVRAEFKRDMPHASKIHYTLGSRSETPQSLSTIVLSEIKNRAEKWLSGEGGTTVTLNRAVVTVPANFPEEAPEATMQAAKDAGFETVKLLDEPTAAALAYSVQEGLKDGQRILVFDFGGGTLDCSILSTPGDDGKPFKVTNPCGDPELGGKDFDQKLVDHLSNFVKEASRMPKEAGVFDVFSDADLGINQKKRALWQARLKEEAERIKIELGSVDATTFSISSDELVDFDNRPLEVTGEVTRVKFETMAAPLIERAVGILQRTLDEAHLTVKEIDRLVLVGGTTTIPAVEAAITAKLGVRPYRNVDRLTAIAQGAAILALWVRRDGEKGGSHIDILDALASHNFGVRYGLNRLDTLIRKNEKLPSSAITRTYEPRNPDAEDVRVPLYQYDDSVATRGKDAGVVIEDKDIEERRAFEIGQVHVDGLSGANRAIDVTFRMDDDRILSVVVKRQADGREFPLNIHETR